MSQVIRAAAGSEASTHQSDQIAVFDVVEKTKCFGEIKQVSVGFFFKHCEHVDHHPAMQRHLEEVEAIEVLDCTLFKKEKSQCES